MSKVGLTVISSGRMGCRLREGRTELGETGPGLTQDTGAVTAPICELRAIGEGAHQGRQSVWSLVGAQLSVCQQVH